MRERVEDYLSRLADTVGRVDRGQVAEVARSLLEAFYGGRRVFLLGNGGSASTASHFACDLGKGTASIGRRRFKVVALTDNVPTLTAWANDKDYRYVFSEPLANLIEPGDRVVAFSGSGNSPNVLEAMESARRAGARRIGFTGSPGGKLRECTDLCVMVPSSNMQRIEDVHLALAHTLYTCLSQAIAENARRLVVMLRGGVEADPKALWTLVEAGYELVFLGEPDGRGGSSLLKRARRAGLPVTASFDCPHGSPEACPCWRGREPVFRRAAEQLCVELEAVLFIDTRVETLEEARRWGCRTVLIGGGQAAAGAGAEIAAASLEEAASKLAAARRAGGDSAGRGEAVLLPGAARGVATEGMFTGEVK